jgi:Zinc finger, ZZ type/EF-hand domain pair
MNPSLNDPRFRPALLALAGISAAYALYLIRQRYIGPRETSEPQSQLRRRNAIHRHHAPRRRRTRSSPQEVDSIEIGEQAIAALRTREEEVRSYGFLDIHSIEQEVGRDTGRRRETRWPLLPALLPTAEQFQAQEEGISAEDAQGLRNHAEVMFMNAFLVNECPPGHSIGQLEATYFQEQLSSMGIGSSVVQQSIERFNANPHFGSEIRQMPRDRPTNPPSVDGATEFQRLDDLFQALDGGETTTDGHSNFDSGEGSGNVNRYREGQNTLDLLYNIAADQARKDGYIHRGVRCDGCGIIPIQGIRYRCANCFDFDLCESCEAQELHIKTHVFYKVRVPAPSLGALGNSRQGLPVWYPGKPSAMRSGLPRDLSSRLLHESGFDTSELDALWDQFRCLAGTEWNRDPNKLGMAIDRKTFDKCFVPPLSIRPPPPNLIYDRMFDFYDANHDGLIGFEEFLKGLASLNDKSREGKLRRIFQGYDTDNDGYVDRKDFLRMFRAFYTLSKEVCRESVAAMEEDLIDGGARDVIRGSQPISSAFPGSIPLGHPSRSGIGKEVDANGDLAITDNGGILDDESHDVQDRNQVIADVAVRYQRRFPEPLSFSQQAETDSHLPGPTQVEDDAPDIHPADHRNPFSENLTLTDEGGPPFHNYEWPPIAEVRPADVANALGSEVPLSEIMDPVDRARILLAQSERIDAEFEADNERRRNDAIQDRWRRRRFYTDVEEGGTAPPGYREADSSEDEADVGNDATDSVTSASISRPLSPRSRSSSKVRFEDSVTDTDYETRSNTSSRSIPVGERWGGYEISEIEKDAGKEILYQAVQQGFNELLDQLFKEKEDLTMEAHKTRKMRRLCAQEMRAFAESLTPKPKQAEDEPEMENEHSITAKADAVSQQTEDADIFRLLQEVGILGDTSTDEEDATSESQLPSPTPFEHPIHTGLTSPDHTSPSCRAGTDHGSAQSTDPTLPQFLPNEPATNAPPPPLSPDPHPNGPKLRTLQETPSADATSPSNPRPSIPPTPTQRKTTLSLYLKHEQVDEEARLRGGFGKLDYGEFVKGMLGDDGSDAKRDAKGNGKWSRSRGGEMGKLGFVGSWIGLASF